MSTARTPRKYRRLTARHILLRIRRGTLMVDVFEGLVFVRRTENHEWRELTIYYTPRGRPYVRIYFRGRRCGIMRNRLVWIAAHEKPIPKDHEVHHRNRDHTDDSFGNLRCITRDEHYDVHF